jgi:hypothetical protein
MKVDFSFILLLALSVVVDLHVKLGRADMEVEGHEEALVDVVVFYKLRPATLKVLLAVAIIPNFHFVWSPTARLLAKNRFSQFTSIHEVCEIQRQTLNLVALRHSNAEEREDPGKSSRSSGSNRRRSAWTWGSDSHLGLVFATRWAAGTTLNRSGR